MGHTRRWPLVKWWHIFAVLFLFLPSLCKQWCCYGPVLAILAHSAQLSNSKTSYYYLHLTLCLCAPSLSALPPRTTFLCLSTLGLWGRDVQYCCCGQQHYALHQLVLRRVHPTILTLLIFTHNKPEVPRRLAKSRGAGGLIPVIPWTALKVKGFFRRFWHICCLNSGFIPSMRTSA